MWRLFILLCLLQESFASIQITENPQNVSEENAIVVQESSSTQNLDVIQNEEVDDKKANEEKNTCYNCQEIAGEDVNNAIANSHDVIKAQEKAREEEIKQITPELLVTSITISGHRLEQDFFVMQYKNKIFISLKDFVSTLIFNITEDSDGNYTGNFINESNSFSYNKNTRIAKINGYVFTVNNDDIFVEDGVIYFSTSTFEKFFPLHITFQARSQDVQIESMEVLPIVKEILRKKRYAKFQKQGDVKDATNPEISKYDMLSMPFIDIVNNTSFNSGQKTATNNTVLFANMHFLKTLTTITGNINKSSGNNATNVRIKNTYQDLENPNKSHILKPRKFEIGDINSSNINGVVNSVNGIGVSVSNISPTWRIDLNQLNVNGYSNPNWDVEFYLNNILYDVGKVASDGLYNFENVPLNVGQNTVKLIFYGPNGQKKEQIKYINLDSTLVQKGAIYYNLSSTQANNFLLTKAQNQFAPDDKIDMLQLQYGLTNLQTVNFSVTTNTTSFSGKKKDQYISAGINSFAFGIPLDVSYIDYNNGEGYAVSSKTTFDLKTIHFNARHLLVSENYHSRTLSGQMREQYVVNASHTGRFFSSYVRNSITFENQSYKNIASNKILTYSVGTRVFNVNLNNNLIFRNTQSFADGNFLASYRHGTTLFLRTNLVYVTNKEFFRSISGTVNYTPTKFGVNTTLATDLIIHSINLGVSYNSSIGIISMDGSYNTNKVFGIRFSIASGIIPTNNMYISEKPIANTSAIKARVFIDNNDNNRYDKGDEPVKNAKIRINNTVIKNKTDRKGRIFITPITSNSSTKISLDQSSIGDIYIVPKKQRYDIIIPEAKIHSLNIPLARTGIIDGFLTIQTKNGKKNVSGANIYLANKKGQIISQTKSASDGYYLFDVVQYGTYNVIVDDKYVEKYIDKINNTDKL